jgi:hypothetical protein
MATKKSKMSAEEKAVRDAFAAVQADTGLEQARQIIQTGVVPTATPTSTPTKQPLGGISDIDTSTAFGKQAFDILSKLQSSVNKKELEIAKQYEDLGYTYDPITGKITPKASTNQDGSGVKKDSDVDKNTRNAFAILKQVFSQYGLGDLSSVIETLMKEGYEPEEATLALKTDPRYNKAYITRFRGNELRRSAGLNVLTEAEYLTLEDDYTKTLKSYGLESYFGVDKSIKQSAMADVIGADISAVEFTERVSTAVDRVKMADPATKNAFQQFYGIGEADLVQYFLDPKKALVNLKEKAVSAEIGGAALGQGLTATATSAEDLARFGINREQAQAGYSTIAQELPTAAKLGDIYSETGTRYTQADAESATFKGLASAKRKKEKLVATEEAQFQGSSGVGAAGLSTTYLRRGSSAGQF